MSNKAQYEIERSNEISFEFDGHTLAGFDGETVAVALLRAGIVNIRNAPNGGPRGMFCVMGICQECVIMVDGKVTEACRTIVSEGLVIERVDYV